MTDAIHPGPDEFITTGLVCMQEGALVEFGNPLQAPAQLCSRKLACIWEVWHS